MLLSRVTNRSQTTLPNEVRKALGLKPGEDFLQWEIRGNEVVARRAMGQEEDDPALLPFLQFLERDIAAHPERVREMPESLYQRLLAVTAGLDGDPDEPIEGLVNWEDLVRAPDALRRFAPGDGQANR